MSPKTKTGIGVGVGVVGILFVVLICLCSGFFSRGQPTAESLQLKKVTDQLEDANEALDKARTAANDEKEKKEAFELKEKVEAAVAVRKGVLDEQEKILNKLREDLAKGNAKLKEDVDKGVKEATKSLDDREKKLKEEQDALAKQKAELEEKLEKVGARINELIGDYDAALGRIKVAEKIRDDEETGIAGRKSANKKVLSEKAELERGGEAARRMEAWAAEAQRMLGGGAPTPKKK